MIYSNNEYPKIFCMKSNASQPIAKPVIHQRPIRLSFALFALIILTNTWVTGQDMTTEWKFESQRKEIAPVSSIDRKNTFRGEPTLTLSGGGKEYADGHWFKYVNVDAGAYFEFKGYYLADKVEDAKRNIQARIIWLNNAGQQIGFTEYPVTLPDKTKEGWNVFDKVYQVPAETSQAKLELHYRWDADGIVRFSNVSFQKTTPPQPRIVKVATVHHKPHNSKSAQDNLNKFASLVDLAGAQKADIVCLPEALTMVGTGISYVNSSEPIPGPSTKFLGEVARKNHLYIVAGLLEKDGAIVYNTAVLIDRDGKLVGKYRKVSLPREEIDGGITPGDSYPVFDTDFGKIGMMICWDVTFPDAAKTLAQHGAEIILMPIAGGYVKLAMARALENQVYLVSSTYDMISAVFDLEGNVISEATDTNPVAVTEVDLNYQKLWPWIGDLKSRIPREMPPQKATQLK